MVVRKSTSTGLGVSVPPVLRLVPFVVIAKNRDGYASQQGLPGTHCWFLPGTRQLLLGLVASVPYPYEGRTTVVHGYSRH